MKKIVFCFCFIFCINNVNSQDSDNNWSIGFGISNFSMTGDLVSKSDNQYNSFINLGTYLYVDKMFSQTFGLELKAYHSKISGGNDFSNKKHSVLYLDSNSINYLYFKGKTWGAEVNLIFNINSIFKLYSKHLNFNMYIGIGSQLYYSTVHDKLNSIDKVVIDYRDNSSRFPSDGFDYNLNSYYSTFQIGMKYHISKRINIEFRPTWNINFKDDLDGVISNKNNTESFFVTNFGLSFNFIK
jgi:hypothetical protein